MSSYKTPVSQVTNRAYLHAPSFPSTRTDLKGFSVAANGLLETAVLTK